jgi:hypothetical protein
MGSPSLAGRVTSQTPKLFFFIGLASRLQLSRGGVNKGYEKARECGGSTEITSKARFNRIWCPFVISDIPIFVYIETKLLKPL